MDLELTKDGKRFLVQCKQYRASTVSVVVVREIFGFAAARRAAGAIVVTTGSFTKDAVCRIGKEFRFHVGGLVQCAPTQFTD